MATLRISNNVPTSIWFVNRTFRFYPTPKLRLTLQLQIDTYPGGMACMKHYRPARIRRIRSKAIHFTIRSCARLAVGHRPSLQISYNP